MVYKITMALKCMIAWDPIVDEIFEKKGLTPAKVLEGNPHKI